MNKWHSISRVLRQKGWSTASNIDSFSNWWWYLDLAKVRPFFGKKKNHLQKCVPPLNLLGILFFSLVLQNCDCFSCFINSSMRYGEWHQSDEGILTDHYGLGIFHCQSESLNRNIMLNKQLLTVEFLKQAGKSHAVCTLVLYEQRTAYPKTLLHRLHTTLLLTFCLLTTLSLGWLSLLGGTVIVLTLIYGLGGLCSEYIHCSF